MQRKTLNLNKEDVKLKLFTLCIASVVLANKNSEQSNGRLLCKPLSASLFQRAGNGSLLA